ncbi:MAG: autotransporter-associated beta strand repeat-containing protein [Kiritimatiellae bacterium]|nr:autotransporter-associated beta strand repeat-containing protein [Kiritimatiellia bacterium]
MNKLITFATSAIFMYTISLQAADRTWENTETDFNADGSWVGGTAPGSGDKGIFDAAVGTNPNLTAPITLQGIIFRDNADTYTLTSTGGHALTLTNVNTATNNSPFYQYNTSPSTVITINADLIFGATGSGNAQRATVSTGTLNINGAMTSTDRTVEYNGSSASTINLSGNNDGIQAGFILSGSSANFNILNSSVLSGIGGTLMMGHNNGATINNQSGGTLNVTTPDEFQIGTGSNGSVTLAGDNWNFGATPATIAGNRTLRVNSDLVVLGGGLSGTDMFSKDGAGTLRLGGASTYTGQTRINAGVLVLDHANALADGNLLLQKLQVSPVGESGVLGLGAGDFTRSLGTGVGQIQFLASGGAWQAGGGFAAYGATRVVNLGGASGQVTWNSGSFVGHGHALVFGAADADGTIDFQNGIALYSGSGGVSSREFYVQQGTADVAAEISGIISNGSGNRGITKTGDGTLSLTAANTYTGTTEISAGTLRVNGSIASSTTNINSGGALGGSGSVNTINLNTGGALTPGNSIGTLSGTSMTWNGEADDSFGQMQFELSNSDNSSDQLDLSGAFTKGSGGFFTFDFLGTGAADQTYTLVNFGSTNFAVDDFEYTGLASGLSGEFSLNGDNLQLSVIPEPGTFTLLIIGFCGLAFTMKRRRK